MVLESSALDHLHAITWLLRHPLLNHLGSVFVSTVFRAQDIATYSDILRTLKVDNILTLTHRHSSNTAN